MKYRILISCLLTCAFSYTKGQNIVEEIKKENEAMLKATTEQKKLLADSATLSKSARKYAGSLNNASTELVRSRVEFNRLSVGKIDTALIRKAGDLAKLRAENVTLNEKLQQQGDIKKQLQKNAVPSDDKTLKSLLENLENTQNENTALKLLTDSLKDEADRYEKRVKNAKQTGKANAEMEEYFVGKYNLTVQDLKKDSVKKSLAVTAINKEKQELIKLGINPERLPGIDGYLSYLNLLKSADSSLMFPYDKKIKVIVQSLNTLRSDDDLDAVQQKKLDDKVKLLNGYCIATNKCVTEIKKMETWAGLPGLELKVNPAINILLDDPAINCYRFIKEELERLKTKFNFEKDKGFNSRIKECKD